MVLNNKLLLLAAAHNVVRHPQWKPMTDEDCVLLDVLGLKRHEYGMNHPYYSDWPEEYDQAIRDFLTRINGPK